MKNSIAHRLFCFFVSLQLVLSLVPVEALAEAVGNSPAATASTASSAEVDVAKTSSSEPDSNGSPSSLEISEEIEGLTVRLRADGSLPRDALLTVEDLAKEPADKNMIDAAKQQLAEIEKAVEIASVGDREVATVRVLRIVAQDAEGNEVALPKNETAQLTFEVAEKPEEGSAFQVYHVKENPKTEAEGVPVNDEDAPAWVAGLLEREEEPSVNTIVVSVEELGVFVLASAPLKGDESSSVDEVTPLEVQQTTVDAPDPEGSATTTSDETASQQTSTTTQVTAKSATQNIVGEVFANAANEALEQQEGLGETMDDASLEEYPTESNDESYYDGSDRLRELTTADGSDAGFLVYRDTFFVVPQEESNAYHVTWSEDKLTAYVTPAIDPNQFEGKTGIVLLQQDVGDDVVLVFAEGQMPTLEGNTLVVPLEPTEDISLNQLFSDGSLNMHAEYGGPSSLGPESVVIANDEPRTVTNALGIKNTLLAQPTSTVASNLGARGILGAQGAGVLSKGSNDSATVVLHPKPKGTNWEGTIDYTSVGVDKLGAHVDIDIWDLELDLVVDLALHFDFDVTSTGSSGKRESVEVVAVDVPIELFTLHYAALLEAEFDKTPVHVAGKMSPSMECHINPLFGFSIQEFKTPIALKTFELKHPERDKNTEFKCYLGTGFAINESFLSKSLDLGFWEITIGPLVSLNQLSQGGTYYTARFDKDHYDPDTFARTSDSVHACAANGMKGCYLIHTKGSSDYNYNLKLDLYFKSWTWNLKDKHEDLGESDYHNSLTYETGLKEGLCPNILYRVPVAVWQDDAHKKPAANMIVSVNDNIESLYGSPYKLTNGTSDKNGKLTIYLPYRSKYYTYLANGTLGGKSVIGSAEGHVEKRANDTVHIVVGPKKTTTVRVAFRWNADTAGLDVPEKAYFVFQRRLGGTGQWEDAYGVKNRIVERELYGDDGWEYQEEFPQSGTLNGKTLLYEYRVRAYRDGYVATEDGDEGAYVRLGTGSYVNAAGETESPHLNNYYAEYEDEYADGTYATTITMTPMVDITMRKQWQLSNASAKPESVYLALTQSPEANWEDLAAAKGVPKNWLLVQNPMTGSANSLNQLTKAGIITTDNLRTVGDVPLTIAKVDASNNWSTTFQVPKYRDGVKMRYEATELSDTVLNSFLIHEYDLQAEVAVSHPNTYTCISGVAFRRQNDYSLLATVVNHDHTSSTIAGTVRWEAYGSGGEGRVPSQVKVHVTKDGSEITDSPITLSKDSFSDKTEWTWELSGSHIDPEADYKVTEELTGADGKSWTWQATGLNIYNWRTYYETVTLEARAGFEDGVAVPDELSVRVKGNNNNVLTTLSLTPRFPFGHYSLGATTNGLSDYSIEAGSIPGCVRIYREPFVYVLGDGRVYNYTVYYASQKKMTINVSNIFTNTDSSTVYPQALNVHVYRDGEEIATPQLKRGANGTWSTASVTKDKQGKDLYRVSDTGHHYLYTVSQDPVPGFTPSVAQSESTSDRLNVTLRNEWVGSDYQTVTGTITWVGDEGYTDLRPDPAHISVVNGNGEYAASTTVQKSGAQTFNVTYLPGKDSKGKTSAYSVLQDHVDYYTTTYSDPVYNTKTRTWTCNITNTLTGVYPLTIKKKIAGNHQGNSETYTFTVEKAQPKRQDDENPQSQQVTITGEGEARVPLKFKKDGLYFYIVKEAAGSDTSCTYDTAKRLVLIARTTEDDGSVTYKCYVGDYNEKTAAEAAKDIDPKVIGSTTSGVDPAALLQILKGDRANAVEFTNKYSGISIEKKWDIDLEGKDKPSKIEVMLQKQDGGSWQDVQKIELKEDNNWRQNLAYPAGTNESTTFRVRELKDESVGSLVGESRIVYDSGDADKGDATTNEVVYHVGGYESVLSGTEPAHDTKYKVSYASKKEGQTQSFSITNKAIVEVDVIKRWIGIGVDDEDMPDSAWLVLLCSPKTGSLDAAKGLATSAGVDLGGVLDYEFPVINPIEGGQDPITILGQMALGIDLSWVAKLAKGIFGIKIPELAMKKVTKADNWTYKVVESKYTAGIPMEYKGAELTSEIIRQIVKYLTDGFIDSPVSFNPFDGYISIPTKAIPTILGIENIEDITNLSGLEERVVKKAKELTKEDFANPSWRTLLTDYHLMANVFNIKVDWDTTDPTPEDNPNTVRGVKTWNDQDNKFGTRPNKIKVYLLANGQRVKDDDGKDVYVETSKQGGWYYSFANRATHDGENPITYTVEEEAVPGYTTTYDGYNITNTLETVDLTFTKYWDDGDNRDGLRPSSVDIQLLADGEVVETHTVTAADKWVWDIGVRPKYNKSGKEIAYTVEEQNVPSEYTALPYAGQTTNKLGIVNRHEIGLKTLTLSKHWDDANNQDGRRPYAIGLYLKGSDGSTRIYQTDTESDWTKTVVVPKYMNGQEIAYSLVEPKVPWGYTKTELVEGDQLTVTNKHTPETLSIRVSKTWEDDENRDGIQPDSVTVHLRANGEVAATKSISVSDGWKCTFENMPKYRNGRLIAYTVSEEAVEGYTAKVEGNATTGFTITNTHEPETMILRLEKTWDDNNDQDGKRPDLVTLLLKGNGTVVREVPVSANNGWSGTVIVPKNDSGTAIEYTLDEKAVGDYQKTIITTGTPNFLRVENRHTPEKISISGTKVWDDDNDRDGKRPDSVTVALYANGVQVATQEVSSAGDGKWSFEGKDKYAGGKEIVYTVGEVGIPDGYTSTVTGSLEDGFTITNKHTPETVRLRFQKLWKDDDNQDGKRPKSLTLQLKANGTVVKTLEVPTSRDWASTYVLPEYENGGQQITYTLDEPTVPEGYTKTVSADGLRITNTHTPETMDITVKKVWDDANNQDGKRPGSVSVRLHAYGSVVKFETANAANNWTCTFTGWPKYRDGKEYAYTVSEGAVEGYTSKVSGSVATGFTITNSYTPEKTQVSVYKVWEDEGDREGLRPTSVTVHLLENGTDKGKKLTLDEGNSWSGVFDDLDKKEAGTDITYTVKEDAVVGYTQTCEDGATFWNRVIGSGNLGEGQEAAEAFENTFFITNTHETTDIDIRGTATWSDDNDRDGLRPKGVKVWLLSDDMPIAWQVVSPDDSGAWTYDFGKFPQYREGKAVTYSVKEQTEDGTGEPFSDRPIAEYTTEYATPAVNGNDCELNIANAHTPETTDVEVQKIWDDRNNAEGVRPTSVRVHLKANGVDIAETDVLNSQNNWHCRFTNLPKNAAGVPIAYTVEEETVDGYTLSTQRYVLESNDPTDDSRTYIALTNTHETQFVDIKGAVTWNDANDNDRVRPDGIKVWLLSDGMPIAWQVVSPNETGAWTYDFGEFPVWRDGHKVSYAVREDVADGDGENLEEGRNPIAGYTTSYKPLLEQGNAYVLDLTNTHEPETTTLTVHKLWDDANDQDGKRPSSVKVHLCKDGAATETDQVLTLNANENWEGVFKDLPKYKNGELIQYSVVEDTVASYSTSISSYTDDFGAHAFVTNTHVPERVEIKGNKVWDDANDQDHQRRDSIMLHLYADRPDADTEDTIDRLVTSLEVEKPSDGSASNTWSWQFPGSYPKFYKGKEITYSVEEDHLVGYKTAVTGNVASGFAVTNSHDPDLTYVDVGIIWEDEGNQDGKRPDSVKMRLYADGKQTDKTLTLSEENDWHDMFSGADMPRNRLHEVAEGQAEKIEYSVRPEYEETDPFAQYYDHWVFGNTNLGYVVLAFHDPETITIKGSKEWVDANDQDGMRPASIEVILEADGIPDAFCTTSAEKDWQWEFEGVKAYSGGKKVEYRVREVDVAGYESSVSDPVTGEDGSTQDYVITNTHTPEVVDVSVRKVWKDDNNADGIRPNAVTVHLIANGVDTGKFATLNEDCEWSASFTELDKFQAGTEIAYTVVEDAVEGYTPTVTGSVAEGYVITNTHERTPEPPAMHVITYDLNGGSYKGNTDKILESHAHGSQITIHEAPEREGYEFDYWKGSSYHPGDSYTVVEDHTFVAQWKKVGTPTAGTGRTTLARTADGLWSYRHALAIAAAGLLLCALGRYLRQKGTGPNVT